MRGSRRLVLVLVLVLGACGSDTAGPVARISGNYVAESWDSRPLPLVLGEAATGYPTGGTITLVQSRHEYTALRLRLDDARHYELRGDLRITPLEGAYSVRREDNVLVDGGTYGYDPVKGELLFTAPGNAFSLRNGTVSGGRATVHVRWLFDEDSTDATLVFNRSDLEL